MKFKGFAAGAAITTLLAGCGGGGSDDGYKPLKSFSPASLSKSEQSAAGQAFGANKQAGGKQSATVNGSTTSFSYGTNALALGMNSAESIDRSFKISEEGIACQEGGTLSLNGEARIQGSGDEKNMKASATAKIEMAADQCKDEDSLIDGKLTVTLTMNISGSETKYTGSAAMAFLGGFKGYGLNEKGEQEEHSLQFKDLDIRIKFDQDSLKKYENANIDEMTPEQLKEIAECKGSVTLDSRELTCGEFILAANGQDDEFLAQPGQPQPNVPGEDEEDEEDFE